MHTKAQVCRLIINRQASNIKIGEISKKSGRIGYGAWEMSGTPRINMTVSSVIIVMLSTEILVHDTNLLRKLFFVTSLPFDRLINIF